MVNDKQEPVPENESHKILQDFYTQTYHLILAKTPHIVLINQKKEFVIKWILLLQQTTNWILKKAKKKPKIQLLEELTVRFEESLRAWKVKPEELKIKERIDSIQNTALWRSAIIRRRVLKTLGDLL